MEDSVIGPVRRNSDQAGATVDCRGVGRVDRRVGGGAERQDDGVRLPEADRHFLAGCEVPEGQEAWGADYVPPTAAGPAAERRQQLIDLREASRAEELAVPV